MTAERRAKRGHHRDLHHAGRSDVRLSDGRTYGKFACDGSCTQCVAPVVAAARGCGHSGTAATSVPGRGAAGSGIPSGAAGRG